MQPNYEQFRWNETKVSFSLYKLLSVFGVLLSNLDFGDFSKGMCQIAFSK